MPKAKPDLALKRWGPPGLPKGTHDQGRPPKAPARPDSTRQARPLTLCAVAEVGSGFEDVRSLMRELQDRYHLGELLQWDHAAYPGVDAAMRSRQEALAARDRHSLLTSDRLGEALDRLDRSKLSVEQAAMVRMLENERASEIRVSPNLAAEIARVRVEAKQAWDLARAERAWEPFEPMFRQVVDLARAKAEVIGFSQEPMDAWLDQFEPGLTTAQMANLLSRLEQHLTPFVEQGASADTADWSTPKVRALVLGELKAYLIGLCSRLGFDPGKGVIVFGEAARVIDVGPGAIRVFFAGMVQDATAYLRTVCHEMGHAMYEQGLPLEWSDSPIGTAPSLAFNEAQAAFWENHICRALEFWQGQAGLLGGVIPALAGLEPLQFYQACNRIRREEDALQADEFTHVAQISIRFEIERRLLGREITTADVPAVFVDLLRSRLRVEPSSPLVFLQDLQWPYGYFGYLAIYTLSRVYASWLYEAACTELAGEDQVRASVRDRNFLPLNEWLYHRVYRRGALLGGRELLAEVAGPPSTGDVDPSAYLRHLERRFNELYG